MTKIDPIKIVGEWVDGYALDYHVLDSVYLGMDESGYDRFDSTRSELGQLLYELKYREDVSNVEHIGRLIRPFLLEWDISKKVDCVIPAPPTKGRMLQPVHELSKQIGHIIKKPVGLDLLEKNDSRQLKNLNTDHKTNLKGTIQQVKPFKKKVNVLLVDDLYQTGKTLNEASYALHKDINVHNIYVLTMTKTRR